jgi:hypothetical protein
LFVAAAGIDDTRQHVNLTAHLTPMMVRVCLRILRLRLNACLTPAPTEPLLLACTFLWLQVQHVSCLAFKRVFTSLVEAEERADKRSVRFRMVSSGLYHDYGCTFVVEPLEAPAPPTTTVLVVEAGSAAARDDTKAGVERKGTDHGSVGARVQYTGHFRMKVAPPPPLSRMLVPRALHSGTVTMLSMLQSRVSRPS